MHHNRSPSTPHIQYTRSMMKQSVKILKQFILLTLCLCMYLSSQMGFAGKAKPSKTEEEIQKEKIKPYLPLIKRFIRIHQESPEKALTFLQAQERENKNKPTLYAFQMHHYKHQAWDPTKSPMHISGNSEERIENFRKFIQSAETLSNFTNWLNNLYSLIADDEGYLNQFEEPSLKNLPEAVLNNFYVYCVTENSYPINQQLDKNQHFGNSVKLQDQHLLSFHQAGAIIENQQWITRWHFNQNDLDKMTLSENAVIYLMPLGKLKRALWVYNQNSSEFELYTLGPQDLSQESIIISKNELKKSFLWHFFGGIPLEENKNKQNPLYCPLLIELEQAVKITGAHASLAELAKACIRYAHLVRAKCYGFTDAQMLHALEHFFEGHANKSPEAYAYQSIMNHIGSLEQWVDHQRRTLMILGNLTQPHAWDDDPSTAIQKIKEEVDTLIKDIVQDYINLGEDANDIDKNVQKYLGRMSSIIQFLLKKAIELRKFFQESIADPSNIDNIPDDKKALLIKVMADCSREAIANWDVFKDQFFKEGYAENKDFYMFFYKLCQEWVSEFYIHTNSVLFKRSQEKAKSIQKEKVKETKNILAYLDHIEKTKKNNNNKTESTEQFNNIIRKKSLKHKKPLLKDPFGQLINEENIKRIILNTKELKEEILPRNRKKLLEKLDQLKTEGLKQIITQQTPVEERIRYTVEHVYMQQHTSALPLWPEGSSFGWLMNAPILVGPKDYDWDALKDPMETTPLFPDEDNLWPLASGLLHPMIFQVSNLYPLINNQPSKPCFYFFPLKETPSFWLNENAGKKDNQSPCYTLCTFGPIPLTRKGVILIPDSLLSVFALCNPGFFEAEEDERPLLLSYDDTEHSKAVSIEQSGEKIWTITAIFSYLESVFFPYLQEDDKLSPDTQNELFNTEELQITAYQSRLEEKADPKDYFSIPVYKFRQGLPLSLFFKKDESDAPKVLNFRESLDLLSIIHFFLSPYIRDGSFLWDQFEETGDFNSFLKLIKSSPENIKKILSTIHQQYQQFQKDYPSQEAEALGLKMLKRSLSTSVYMMERYMALLEEKYDVPHSQRVGKQFQGENIGDYQLSSLIPKDWRNADLWKKPLDTLAASFEHYMYFLSESHFDEFAQKTLKQLLHELEGMVLETADSLKLDLRRPEKINHIPLEAHGESYEDPITGAESFHFVLKERQKEGSIQNITPTPHKTYDGLNFRFPEGIYKITYKPIEPPLHVHNNNRIETPFSEANLPISITKPSSIFQVQHTDPIHCSNNTKNLVDVERTECIIAISFNEGVDADADHSKHHISIDFNAPGDWSVHTLLPSSLLPRQPWWASEWSFRTEEEHENLNRFWGLHHYAYAMTQWAHNAGIFLQQQWQNLLTRQSSSNLPRRGFAPLDPVSAQQAQQAALHNFFLLEEADRQQLLRLYDQELQGAHATQRAFQEIATRHPFFGGQNSFHFQ